MKIYVDIYGTDEEVVQISALISKRRDSISVINFIGEKEDTASKNGMDCKTSQWHYEQNCLTSHLIETIRAFSLLHPHVAYEVKGNNGLTIESNNESENERQIILYRHRKLTLQEILMRIRQSISFFKASIKYRLKDSIYWNLLEIKESLEIVHQAYVEYMFRDIQTCITYTKEHKQYMEMRLHLLDTRYDKTALCGIIAVIAMCEEALQ